MTQIVVNGRAVALLGAELSSIAADLAALPQRVGAAEGFPPGAAARALDDVLGDWLYQRGRLAQRLDGLGELARIAGTAYVTADADVQDSFVRGDSAR